MKTMAFNMLTDWKKRRRIVARDKYSSRWGIKYGWSKPSTGWVKINVDAACKPNSLLGVGCVTRDEIGRFLQARSNVIEGDMQPRMAEAWPRH